jgi:ribulose-phosphate 3-epimerase
MDKKIIPAIIAKDQKELNEKLSRVIDYVDVIQLDVMDNKFVPNTSLFFDFFLTRANCHYEAHLMVQDPQGWIDKNIEKIDTVLVHFESKYNPETIIDNVKRHGKRFGFVLNPETSVQKIKRYIDDIDQVLVMTVNPGFYGSPFLPEMLEKISKLRKLKPEMDIEVDGGITDKTIGFVDKAGANMFVSGSYIVKSDNVEQSVKNLKEIVGK